MNAMKDYHDLYLTVYVLLFAYAFETFTEEPFNSFELDPLPYLSLPGYSWEIMPNFTDVTLKLISDIEK